MVASVINPFTQVCLHSVLCVRLKCHFQQNFELKVVVHVVVVGVRQSVLTIYIAPD